MSSLLVASVACTQPEGSPGAAAQAYFDAVVARDGNQIYPWLDAGTQKTTSELFKTLQSTRSLIEKHYKGLEKIKAVRATGVDVLKESKTAPELFTELLLKGGNAGEVSTLQSWGMTIRSINESDGGAKVQTVAGDTLELVKQGDRWAVKLSTDDLSRLQALKRTAEQDLAKIQSNIKAIAAKRYGTNTASD